MRGDIEGGRKRSGAKTAIRAALAVLIVSAAAAQQADPPHWTNTRWTMDCTSQCHVGHQSGNLTQADTNVSLCQSCHTAAGLGGSLPINTTDIAVRNVRGTSHAFDVPTVNTDIDTQDPLSNQMLARTPNGNVVCSTCHNQHKAESSYGGRSRIGSAVRTTALGSTGDVTSGGTFTGVAGLWYLVEIVTAGNQASAAFHYSKDNGMTWSSSLGAGTDVPLDNGVTVTFASGNYEVGERWEFTASWMFLRVNMDDGDNAVGDKYCRDCHRAWEMDHTEVETWDDTYKSHPVGVALDANGHGYDRAVPLDGNGADQGSAGADSNPTNDLNRDSGSLVQCTTCHGIHYADSNTLTVDEP